MSVDLRIIIISFNMDYLELYKNLFAYQFLHMNVAYILCVTMNNGSWVDFGWPSGFTVMAGYYFYTGEADLSKKLIITIPYLIAGLRFMLGWVFGRRHHKYEDARWNLWREKWRNGEGLFGIRSVAINFFFFYHTQSMTNVFIMSLPLYTICNSKNPIGFIEVFGLLLWIVSFILENVADTQLNEFKIKNKGSKLNNVMREGLWGYSRHPNYFFEFLLWIAYAVIAYPSLDQYWQYLILFSMPIVAYWYLVDFTGVPMCEKNSLKNRGETYRKYQAEVNMFFPWYPKLEKNN